MTVRGDPDRLAPEIDAPLRIVPGDGRPGCWATQFQALHRRSVTWQ